MPSYHGYKYSMSDVPKDLGGTKVTPSDTLDWVDAQRKDISRKLD